MRRLARSPVILVATVLAVTAGFLVFARSYLAHPRIRMASLQEVEEAVPQALLIREPEDSAVRPRLKALLMVTNAFNASSPTGVGHNHDPVWTLAQVTEFERILNSWPAHSGRSEAPIEGLTSARADVRALAATAGVLAKKGDTRDAVNCLAQGAKFSDDIFQAGGTLKTYFDAVLVETISTAAIEKFARSPKASASDCRLLLQAMSPSPVEDHLLAAAELSEFQRFTLPKLPDPFKSGYEIDLSINDSPEVEATPSSYDALETAKKLGQIVTVSIANTKRPLIAFDGTGNRIAQEAGHGLPDLPTMSQQVDAKGQIVRSARASGDNVLGRKLIYLAGDELYVLRFSFRWRTMRDAVRVLLASRLYRAEHGGNLPSTSVDLVPYLGKWPIDLYDGKPMRYNPVKQVVYSVGANLIDDGGEIEGRSYELKDVGVSLALTHS